MPTTTPFKIGLVWLFVLLATSACTITEEPTPIPSRAETIPTDAVKILPEMDMHPPLLHSEEWQAPIPVPGPINTAGAEDSPFVTPDGDTLYFFFTPDPNIPAERQLVDGVTGIYVSHKQNGVWAEPQKVALQDAGEVAMDGCQFVQGDVIWFCSVRQGNSRGVDMWTAQFVDGNWTDWQNVGEKLNLDYGVGEMHLTADGTTLYYHSTREGGYGGYDIWVTHLVDGEWTQPLNVQAVNSPETDGWPFISQDGNELWFLRWYQGSPAIFRSRWTDGSWGAPELILSQFAGEPSLDDAGNIYFVHHFYQDGVMLEADIYVAYRK